MKYFFIFMLLLAIGAGCKPKVLSGQDLRNKLIETMGDYLHKTLKPDITFTIKDLAYYPDNFQKLYDCQFTVYMHSKTVDTTGVMLVTITNDFKDVQRSR